LLLLFDNKYLLAMYSEKFKFMICSFWVKYQDVE
jgi:hypothetical protein